jgi:hypothetical protein
VQSVPSVHVRQRVGLAFASLQWRLRRRPWYDLRGWREQSDRRALPGRPLQQWGPQRHGVCQLSTGQVGDARFSKVYVLRLKCDG